MHKFCRGKRMCFLIYTHSIQYLHKITMCSDTVLCWKIARHAFEVSTQCQDRRDTLYALYEIHDIIEAIHQRESKTGQVVLVLSIILFYVDSLLTVQSHTYTGTLPPQLPPTLQLPSADPDTHTKPEFFIYFSTAKNSATISGNVVFAEQLFRLQFVAAHVVSS